MQQKTNIDENLSLRWFENCYTQMKRLEDNLKQVITGSFAVVLQFL